ncbi:hypothetical protein GOBAR_DD12251 [Gossypium barbadense]|nr:hypothetical protein GOBAR_DD12251 [Gossypium barbadense]
METQNFGNDIDRDPCANGDQNTKKVRFKEAIDGEATNLVVDSGQLLIMSFKDKLLKGGVDSSDGNLEGIFGKNESDFELLEGDVNMSMVNGIPAIAFSDFIKEILFKEMELTVILKLGVNSVSESSMDAVVASSRDDVGEDGEGNRIDYGPWVLVERKSRRGGDLGGSDRSFSVEKEAGSATMVMRCNKARVNSRGDLGSAVEVGCGDEACFTSSSGPTLGSSTSKPGIVRTGQVKDDVSLKSLGKCLWCRMGLAQRKVDDARMNEQLSEKLSGPEEDRRPGQVVH